MNNKEIKELRLVIKEIKQDYREAKKNLRRQYENDYLIAKRELRAAKKKYKEFRYRETKEKENKLDKLLLSICIPFENRANNIRYKQIDPDGYEANLLVKDAERIIKYYDKRIENNKAIKARDVKILTGLQSAIEIIVKKELGTNWQKAKDINLTISNLIKDTPEMKAVEDMFSQLDKVLGQIS